MGATRSILPARYARTATSSATSTMRSSSGSARRRPVVHAARDRAVGTYFHGERSDPVLSIAWSNSGDLQIELIQPHGERPSVYQEFLDAGHEGIHHVAFWTADYDKVIARAAEAGWTVVQSGDSGGATRFAYLDIGVGGTIVEITEQNEGGDGMNDRIRDAAADWDGTDPVRRSSDHDHLPPVAHRHLRARSRSLAALLLRRARLRSRRALRARQRAPPRPRPEPRGARRGRAHVADHRQRGDLRIELLALPRAGSRRLAVADGGTNSASPICASTSTTSTPPPSACSSTARSCSTRRVPNLGTDIVFLMDPDGVRDRAHARAPPRPPPEPDVEPDVRCLTSGHRRRRAVPPRRRAVARRSTSSASTPRCAGVAARATRTSGSTPVWPWEQELGRAGFIGLGWPVEHGGPGATLDAAGHLGRGVRAGRGAGARQPHGREPARADPDRVRDARAAGAVPSRRSGAARSDGARATASPTPARTSPRCRPGPVLDGDEWVLDGPEGLDLARARVALVLRDRAHRAGVGAPRRAVVPARADGPAGRGGPAHRADHRRRRVQRGVLRRRAHRRRPRASARSARVGASRWRLLGFERGVSTLAQQVGFERELDHVFTLARERCLDRDPLVRQRLVDAWIGLRLMRWNAMRSMSARGVPGPEASISKLFWGTWHRELGNLGIDLLGARGTDRRDAPVRAHARTEALPVQPRRHDLRRVERDPAQRARRARAGAAAGAVVELRRCRAG